MVFIIIYVSYHNHGSVDDPPSKTAQPWDPQTAAAAAALLFPSILRQLPSLTFKNPGVCPTDGCPVGGAGING